MMNSYLNRYINICLGGVLLSSVTLLSGCSQPAKNPLSHTPTSTAVHFLESASKHASRQLHNSWGNNGYKDCMDGKHTEEACQAFYKVMLTYRNTNRLYAGLTLSQLTDETVWKSLKSPYEAVVFDEIEPYAPVK